MARVVLAVGGALLTGAAVCYVFADHRALQTRIRDLLQKVIPVLNDTGATYFVCYGTLLGAVREGDVIYGDEDGDICITEKDREAVVRGFRGKPGVRLTEESQRLLRVRSSRHPQAYVDIYVLDDDNKGVLGGRLWGKVDRSLVLETSMVLPPAMLKDPTSFGTRVMGPKDPQATLARIYGPDWQTPRRNDKGVDHRGLSVKIWGAVSPHIAEHEAGFHANSTWKMIYCFLCSVR